MKIGIQSVVIAIAVFSSMGVQASARQAQDSKKSGVYFLYVISTQRAQLKAYSNKKMLLTIKTKNIQSVLAFSDRPNRIAYRMKPSIYAKQVHSGTYSFTQDPPNLVLSIWNAGNIYDIPFKVTSYHIMGGKITYELNSLMPSEKITFSKLSGPAALYIDSFNINNPGCDPTQGSSGYKYCINSPV